jgi:predicted nucleotidyltransferase
MKPDAENETSVEVGFNLHELFIVPPTEIVKLLIPKNKINFLMKSNSNYHVTVRVKCCLASQFMSRSHMFEVKEVINLPTNPSELREVW